MSNLPKNEEATKLTGAAEQAIGQAGLIKRPVADDDIQFISSNPVKKRRMTEQKPAQTTESSMAPPPAPTVKRLTPTTEQIPSVDRSRSLCGIGQAKGPVADAMLETRGTSLPVLENFAFPKSFPPLPNQPSRLSVAISPRQLPQAFTTPSEVDAHANQPAPPAPDPAAQDSITLDQISCLDFNGLPLNTPGFDMSQIFSADGGIMGGLGSNSTGASAPAPPAPLNALNAQNTIPFTMYSTGNIVTLPQTTGSGQPLAPFPSLPMMQPKQHGAFALGSTRGSQVQYPINHLPREQSASSRSPSPAPGANPACLHCARLRQENLLRRPQAAPGSAAQAQPSPSNQQHLCPRSPTPLALPTLRPIPRSTPAAGQPGNFHQRQQQQQHLPAAQFSAAATMPAPVRPGPAPNLLQDIAQTVQASFPYAQVAARHGMAPARVVEVVSGVVIGPLLRGASNDRGVGGRYYGP
ncbi:hypothetical protein N657DRAFT_642238 [Parathielavia appendiculata]|uniref:Uncharacterized protein n=1 Tax=Parathielavia appendiculata TaxID=2587402 RepID=A0AAN6Z4N8_9PEZI|nr:hypothetical protein N657DRAFT_642238 [Parathielavia appendiculata]